MPKQLKDVTIPLADLRKQIAAIQKAGAEEMDMETFVRLLISLYAGRPDTQLVFGDGIVNPLREEVIDNS